MTPVAAAISAVPTAAGSRFPSDADVPNIGDFKDVAVIELLVKPRAGPRCAGTVAVHSGIDKASMETELHHPPPACSGSSVKIGDAIQASTWWRWPCWDLAGSAAATVG